MLTVTATSRGTKYAACYKCRLCGKSFIKSYVSERRWAASDVIDACNWQSEGQHIYDVHECESGGIGIADFLGFKRVENPGAFKKEVHNAGN